MKKYFILIVFTCILFNSYAQGPTWVATTDTTSIIGYSFSSPVAPEKMDTLGFKIYSCALDTLIGFQILEIKYPPCDSSNTQFIAALQAANGDTLKAITNTLFATSNSVILNSQTLDVSNGFSGSEFYYKYNELNLGRAVVSYERFFYKNDFLITFKITGFEEDLGTIQANKNQFFSSITF